METIRLTMAQALVKFLDSQYIAVNDTQIKFVEGVIGVQTMILCFRWEFFSEGQCKSSEII